MPRWVCGRGACCFGPLFALSFPLLFAVFCEHHLFGRRFNHPCHWLPVLQGAPGDAEQLRSQLAEATRENQLLKRAVAIQNTRLQELR